MAMRTKREVVVLDRPADGRQQRRGGDEGRSEHADGRLGAQKPAESVREHDQNWQKGDADQSQHQRLRGRVSGGGEGHYDGGERVVDRAHLRLVGSARLPENREAVLRCVEEHRSPNAQAHRTAVPAGREERTAPPAQRPRPRSPLSTRASAYVTVSAADLQGGRPPEEAAQEGLPQKDLTVS